MGDCASVVKKHNLPFSAHWIGQDVGADAGGAKARGIPRNCSAEKDTPHLGLSNGQKKGLHFLSEMEAINLAITYSRTTTGGTTIGGCMLNGRVRNGNECFHTPMVTRVYHRCGQCDHDDGLLPVHRCSPDKSGEEKRVCFYVIVSITQIISTSTTVRRAVRLHSCIKNASS